MPQTALGERHEVSLPHSRTAYWEYASPGRANQASAMPVVLVHGFRGDHHGLELIARTARSSRVIVPDLPGFGESERLTEDSGPREHTLANLGEWLADFCAEVVREKPFILVGHSFGTLVVANSMQHGLTPESVVLINPISSPALAGPRAILSQLALGYYQLSRILPRGWGYALLRNRMIVRVMSETMAKTRNTQLRGWIHNQHARYFSVFSDRDSLIESFRASISNTVRDYVSVLPADTVIIAADRDDITPLDAQLTLAHELAHARFVVVPEVGHLVHYESPEVVSDVINQMLASAHADEKRDR